MGVEGDYLGMPLRIDALDGENLAYFRHCAAHAFHLQRCASCNLLRYPPSTGCPWCGEPNAAWTPVEGRGAVYTYAEVHHAIQPAFQAHLPYLILLVELDTQKGVPGEHDALRVAGNLATPDGDVAPPDLVARVGIGTRVRMVFKDVAPGLALPLWTIDETAHLPRPGATRRASPRLDESERQIAALWTFHGICHVYGSSQNRLGWTTLDPSQVAKAAEHRARGFFGSWKGKARSSACVPTNRRSEKPRRSFASTSPTGTGHWSTS